MSRYSLAMGNRGKPGEEVVIKIGESLFDTLNSIFESFPEIGTWSIIKSEFYEKYVLIIGHLSLKSPSENTDASAIETKWRERQKLFILLNERIKEIFPLSESSIQINESPNNLSFIFKNPVLPEKEIIDTQGWTNDNDALIKSISTRITESTGVPRGGLLA